MYANEELQTTRRRQTNNNGSEESHPAEKTTRKRKWSLCHFEDLPDWLKDNEYIIFGHRPPLPCIKTCIKSIFVLHSETGNIWTHLIGCALFVGICLVFFFKPFLHVQLSELWVFGSFFLAAILCLGFSWSFHAFYCHSEFVGKIFSKLDYCGISLLIVGSFVPWIYYAFYCDFTPKIIHLGLVTVFGIVALCVSLIDKFSSPEWRGTRAAVFTVFGLSGVCPAVHYAIVEGIWETVPQKSLGYLILQGLIYIAGAGLYVMRVPEKWYPGKFDFWLHSHQIFHVFVIAAALVHFYGVSELATHKISIGNCDLPSPLIVQ